MTDKPMRTAVRKVRNCGYKPLKVIEMIIAGHRATITGEIENRFWIQWSANKHNLKLGERDYNLALMYFDIGYSCGFHYGFNARKRGKKQ